MDITFDKLERAFERSLDRNRRGQTFETCPPEAFNAHAFFHIGEDRAPDEIGIVPNTLPFESIWLITSYRGLAISAYIERVETSFGPMLRPDYLWYPGRIDGVPIRTTEAEVDRQAAAVIDRALNALLINHVEEVDSPVHEKINRGRAKSKTPLTPLPRFIRVMTQMAPTPDAHSEESIVIDDAGSIETRSSPQGHERRGHWRTYKSSGKRVWINETSVLGGSRERRLYHIAA